MIPTQSKAKISKPLSYPIGAEAISDGLADAPHFNDIKLYFSSIPVYPDSKFRRYLREKLPYKVLVAEYWPARSPGYTGMQFYVDRGDYEARWVLRIYPVLRELRFAVNQLLREEALPRLVKWLQASESVGWEMRRHSITFIFAPADNLLSITHNEGA